MEILRRKEINDENTRRLNEAKLVNWGYLGWETHIDDNQNVIAQKRIADKHYFKMFNVDSDIHKKYPTFAVYEAYDGLYPEGYYIMNEFDLEDVDCTDISTLIKEVLVYAWGRRIDYIEGMIPEVESEVPVYKLFADEGFTVQYDSEETRWFVSHNFRSCEY